MVYNFIITAENVILIFMTTHNTKIIAFVGLAGSGKSSAVDYLTSQGFPKVYVGGLILEGLRELGWEQNQENERKYRETMRQKHGNDYFIRRCAEQIERLIDAGQKRIILDGLYTWTEYKFLKHQFPGSLSTVAIVAPKHLRYRRLSQRPVRPLSEEEAMKRDWAEIENLEKGGPIAIADQFVINDGNLEDLYQNIDIALGDVHFCKTSEKC